MKIHFSIEYFCAQAENIEVFYSFGDAHLPLTLNAKDGHTWTGSIDIDPKEEGAFLRYSYVLRRNGEISRKEFNQYPHQIRIKERKDYYLSDIWLGFSEGSFLFSQAVRTAFYPKYPPQIQPQEFSNSLTLKVYAPQIKNNQKLLLSCSAHNWDLAKATPLIERAPNCFEISLDASALIFPLEYKFVVHDEINGDFIWQKGDNFVLAALPCGVKDIAVKTIVEHKPNFDFPFPKAAGIVAPLFSLRTQKSFGVGGFGDIKKLVDWALKCKMKAIQTLPINDTSSGGTNMDASPYTAISVFALHPIYIDLEPLNFEKDEAYFSEQAALNDLNYFDYEKVNAAKRKYLKAAFDNEKAALFESEPYKEFFEESKRWLIPYAAFSYLRDTNKTVNFNCWSSNSKYDEKEILELCSPESAAFNEISFYFYLQYIAHCQLLDAAEYARSKGIILKGDIPIGVSPFSADVWADPELFNIDASCGAPPDIFSLDGQNWGFPTYNWERMAQDDYAWQARRFENLAQYFDAYRIDHILGFFRIWQIPKTSVHGLLGQFNPSLPLTRDEICGWSFEFDEKYLKPFISDESVSDIFGIQAESAKEKYLNRNEAGLYELKPEFDNQRKVQESALPADIKEALYSLISDVLFIRDFKNDNLYHPRILAETSFSFKALSEPQKQAFKRLYDDYYYQRHNDFWRNEALKKLPALLASTSMLVCAEDLGMIPECVPMVLSELEILSLEIERYPKKSGEVFANTKNYPYLSVCSVSTHDTSSLRGFWAESVEKSERYYHQVLEISSAPPKEISPQMCQKVLINSLKSPSMLCMFILQDWLSIDEALRGADIEDERINKPGNTEGSWRYRMPVGIERLMDEDEFNAEIRRMIEENGR